MLILSAEALAEAAGTHPVLGWPGPLCVWTRPGGPPVRAPGDAFEILFDPAPQGLAAILGAVLPRMAYFGHRPGGGLLCATRLPGQEELARLRRAIEADPRSAALPRGGLWGLGRIPGGVIALGAGLAADAGLARSLRPDMTDAEAAAALSAPGAGTVPAEGARA